MSSAGTIELTPRPSMRALMGGSLLHVLVLASLPLAMQPGWPVAAVAALAGLSWLNLRRHPALGFGPRALTRLVWHAQGHWTLHEAAGASHEASLADDTRRLPWLLVLNFALKGGGRRTRLLLGDELDAEPLRRLRARLSQDHIDTSENGQT